jgi:hypothetical protein
MSDTQIRALCHALFDAYESRSTDVLIRLYADDCIIWHNAFGRDTTGAENLERFHDSYRGQRRRTCDDRTVNTFEDGSVIQQTLGGSSQRPPRAVDLHRRPGAGRPHDPHRRVHGRGQVRGLGRKGAGVRKDWQTLELCDRFFDAIEPGDDASPESCYAPRPSSGTATTACTSPGPTPSGFEGKMDVCFVGYVRDGRISRPTGTSTPAG